jgi:hypothetical protein
MTYYGDGAFPALSDEQRARPQARGSAQEVESGALLLGAWRGPADARPVRPADDEIAGRGHLARPVDLVASYAAEVVTAFDLATRASH